MRVTIILLAAMSAMCSTCKRATSYNVNFTTGLNNTLPGTTFSGFERILGKPDTISYEREENGAVYSNYSEKGITLLVKQDTVTAIFYFFISTQYSPFNGTMEYDINSRTRMEDILEKLGQPERTSTSKVSQYGEFPGATEIYFEYEKLGVAFSFLDTKLANVRQFRVK